MNQVTGFAHYRIVFFISEYPSNPRHPSSIDQTAKHLPNFLQNSLELFSDTFSHTLERLQ
jgi:hypothetical protein